MFDVHVIIQVCYNKHGKYTKNVQIAQDTFYILRGYLSFLSYTYNYFKLDLGP